MARRPAKLHPLPPSFQLSNYEMPNDMTNASLVDRVLYDVSSLRWDDARVSLLDNFGRLLGRIQGTPFGMAKISLMNINFGTNCNTADSPNPYTDVAHSISPHIYPSAWFDIQRRRRPPNLLDIELNLAEATDAELLAELKTLLPLWRLESKLPEPTKRETGTVGPSVIKRIIDYKVIPMIHLMTWAKANGFEYSAEQLSRVLFPDELVTAKHMTDTRIPFALVFANRDFQDMLHLWLCQTGGDGKRNGDRLMRDEYPISSEMGEHFSR